MEALAFDGRQQTKQHKRQNDCAQHDPETPADSDGIAGERWLHNGTLARERPGSRYVNPPGTNTAGVACQGHQMPELIVKERRERLLAEMRFVRVPVSVWQLTVRSGYRTAAISNGAAMARRWRDLMALARRTRTLLRP